MPCDGKGWSEEGTAKRKGLMADKIQIHYTRDIENNSHAKFEIH